MFYAPEKCKLKLNNLILNMTIEIGVVIHGHFTPYFGIGIGIGIGKSLIFKLSRYLHTNVDFLHTNSV